MFRQLRQKCALFRFRVLALAGSILLMSGCGGNPTMPEQRHNYSDCWPCSVYETTFTALDQMLRTLMEKSCDNAMTLLGLGLLFWLSMHVGRFVVSIQQPNIRKFIFPMTTVLFKAMIVSAFLMPGTYYLIPFIGENLIQPMFDFFAELSGLVLDSNTFVQSVTQIQEISQNALPKQSNIIFGDTGPRYLELIYRIYIALKMGISLGFTIWRQTGITAWLFGFFCIIVFWMLLLMIPMSFIDSIVRIGACLVLLPFAMVAWVFPSTKHMIGKMWGVLFGSGLTLMFTCFYITLMTYTISIFAERYYPGILGPTLQENDPDLVETVQTMSTSMIGLFVLVLSMNRLGGIVPKLAGQLGGESVDSSFAGAINFGKKLALTTAKAGIALAAASPTMAKSALSDAKDMAKSAAGDAVKGSGG